MNTGGISALFNYLLVDYANAASRAGNQSDAVGRNCQGSAGSQAAFGQFGLAGPVVSRSLPWHCGVASRALVVAMGVGAAGCGAVPAHCHFLKADRWGCWQRQFPRRNLGHPWAQRTALPW